MKKIISSILSVLMIISGFSVLGTTALAEEGDKYVAALVKAGVAAGEITAVNSIALTKDNVVDHVEAGFEVLYGNNCKVRENYWLEICPKFYRYLRPAMTELLTNNVEMAKSLAGIANIFRNVVLCNANTGLGVGQKIENCLKTHKESINQ